ncbi:MAG: hypothetical protein FWD29_07585 [Micrococcales bacterium]|nr:hypothetical protein [Micrococcales bacterium]
MTATVDTNLLLRLVLRDIPKQYEAVRDLVTVPGARFRVTDMAIAELVHALLHHYGLSRSQVAQIVRTVLWDNAFEANKAMLDAVTSVFEKQGGLSFIDCYLAEEAQVTGNAPLLTFDKALAKQHQAAQLVAAKSP